MTAKHIADRWQGGNSENPSRLWAHQPGGAVIVADFSVSKSLRHETQVGNCRYARAAFNVCNGTSVETLERLDKLGISLDDILTRLRMVRNIADRQDLGEQARLTIASCDKVLGA